MRVSTAELLQEVDDLVQEHHELRHPLQEAIFEGRLSRPQLREWVGQLSCIPLYNEAFHGALYVSCPDPVWRVRLAEVVYEEATGRLYSDGNSHHELWLRLGEAIGVTRSEMYGWPLCSEAIAFRATFKDECNRSFLEGIAAHMLASESQSEGYAGAMEKALMAHYGLSKEEVFFFTVHEEADKDHSSIGRELLDQFAVTEDDQNLVRKTVLEHVELTDLLNDGILRRVMAVE